MDAYENEVFSKWANFCGREITYEKHIFLEMHPETCFRQMRRRNRKEELGVDIDYLTRMQALQVEWCDSLPAKQKMVIDMNGVFFATPEYERVVAEIISVVSRK